MHTLQIPSHYMQEARPSDDLNRQAAAVIPAQAARRVGRWARKWAHAIGLMAAASLTLCGGAATAHADPADCSDRWTRWYSVNESHEELRVRFYIESAACDESSCPVRVQFRNDYENPVFFTAEIAYTDVEGEEQIGEGSFRLNSGAATDDDEIVIFTSELNDLTITEFAEIHAPVRE